MLGEEFLVFCEKKRIDIVISHHNDLKKMKAGIEIKWYGNWCINEKYHLRKAIKDFEKVDKYPCPAVALMFLLLVTAPSAPGLKWIDDSVQRGDGVRDEKEFIDLLTNSRRAPDERKCFPLEPMPEISSWNLYAYAYYNSTGQSL